MPQDADKTGREILPIPDQPHRGPRPHDGVGRCEPTRCQETTPIGRQAGGDPIGREVGYGEIAPISRVVVLKSHEVKTGQRS